MKILWRISMATGVTKTNIYTNKRKIKTIKQSEHSIYSVHIDECSSYIQIQIINRYKWQCWNLKLTKRTEFIWRKKSKITKRSDGTKKVFFIHSLTYICSWCAYELVSDLANLGGDKKIYVHLHLRKIYNKWERYFHISWFLGEHCFLIVSFSFPLPRSWTVVGAAANIIGHISEKWIQK